MCKKPPFERMRKSTRKSNRKPNPGYAQRASIQRSNPRARKACVRTLEKSAFRKVGLPTWGKVSIPLQKSNRKPNPSCAQRASIQRSDLVPEKPAFERSKSRHSDARKVGIPTCEKSAFRHGEKSAFHSKVQPKTKPRLRAKSQHPEVQPSHPKSLRSDARKVGIPTCEKSALRHGEKSAFHSKSQTENQTPAARKEPVSKGLTFRPKSLRSNARKVGIPTCERSAFRHAHEKSREMPPFKRAKYHITTRKKPYSKARNNSANYI
jgi:hypothetical protein